MKKIFNIVFFVLILLINFMPEDAFAELKFTVRNIKRDGTNIIIGSYKTYEEALEVMNSYDANIDDMSVIYDENNKIVNSNYAIGNISGRGIIYIYQNKTDRENDKSHYTYIEGDWGSDVAVIDYYPSKKPMVKIKISGVEGWTLASNVDILPLSLDYIKITNESGMIVRKDSSTTSDKLGSISYLSYHVYYETKENEGYTWYKIINNGEYGWVASNKGSWVKQINNELKTYYKKENNNIKHVYRSEKYGSSTINLGLSPDYLELNKKYYSFDGNYFYENIIDMLSDYKKSTYEKAINYNTPYYNYYMYLPSHSKTGYTEDDFNNIIVNYGYVSGKDENLVYVDNEGNFISGVNRTGVSVLYNEGSSFIAFQNNFGINAFTAFSTALNESGRGTNVYAFGKNNVFSIGVCDTCSYKNTKTFTSIYNNLEEYASLVNSKYSNPNSSLYYGSHYGNKGSGMGVNYASDPYWGEKQAQYSYLKDKEFGGNDYNANVIGIKLSYDDVNIHKLPNTKSDIIYTLKNKYKNHSVANIPLIVIGYIITYENDIETKWYKVYTDTSLDENQNIKDEPYKFNKSYGYIKASDIYLSNTEEVIELDDDGYIQTDGLFHLENLTFENDLLNFKGFLIVYETNNIISYSPKYNMIFKNQETKEEYIKELSSLSDVPFEAPSMDGYDYSGSWFSGNLDLSDIKEGDYTIYITASVNGYKTKALLANKFFNRNVTSKYTSTMGRGYQFKTNYYDKETPLELFIRDNGLISSSITPTNDNMYNQYYSVELKDGFLNLVGTSHNVGGNYSNNSVIERQLFITNSKTLENNIIVNTSLVDEKPYEVSLRVSDNLDKTNAWYQVSVDISSLEKGTYILYIKTKVNEVDDYGEVNDILFTNIDVNMQFNDKNYKIVKNKEKRYRLELIVE